MKQDAAHDPECSQVEHFCEASYLKSLVHFPPLTVAVHCRLCNAEEPRVQSVQCGVWSVKCGVSSVKCKVWSVECKV